MGRYVYVPDDDDGPPDPPPIEPIVVEFWQQSEVPALITEGKTLPLRGFDDSIVGTITDGRSEGNGCILTAEIVDPATALQLAAPSGSYSIDRGGITAVPAEPAD